ncbi:MAG: (Fe-S)-binding protein [bacterium]
MQDADLSPALARCNRCGFCQVACPIFRATGHESGVARGRLALLRALEEGRLEWSQGLEQTLFTCLLCGACTTNCFPAIRTVDLVVDARRRYLDRVGRHRLHRLLFDKLLPYPGRMRLAAKAVALGRDSGLAEVASALGLLRIFGREFARSEKILDRVPRRALRERIRPGVLQGHGSGPRVAYFAGCGPDIMTPESAAASIRALLARSREVAVLANGCCGLPAWSYGDLEAARRLAERNLEVLASSPSFDLLVTDCSSCASFLKRYPDLFEAGAPSHSKAQAMAPRVRDWVEWAFASSLAPRSQRERIVATYHDPCHASRGQGLAREPRALLSSLSAIEYRELPEADWCCGGAGSYAFSHFELARRVLARKMDNLERTGAGVLVTSCPACILQLRYGVRMRRLAVRVCHLAEILSRPA